MSSDDLDILSIMAERGEYDRAVSGLEVLIARDPEDTDALALMAWIAGARGADAECERWLAAVFARDEEHRAALTVALQLALRRGKGDEALRLAHRFVALEPANAMARYNLGSVLAQLGRRAEADAAIEDALHLDPDFGPARHARAERLLERGDYDAAHALFSALAAHDPADATAWLGVAVADLRRYRGEPARLALREALRTSRRWPLLWRNLAQAEELCGDYRAALQASARALELEQGSAQAWLDHSQCLARYGFVPAARDAARAAAARAPQRLLPAWLDWQLLDFVHASAADVERARERWREGLSRFEAMDFDTATVRAQLPELLTVLPNFYRHYLADDLTGDQRRYGALLTRMSQAMDIRSEAESPRVAVGANEGAGAGSGGKSPLPVGDRSEATGVAVRRRVAFASAHLRRHTIWKLFHRWIAKLDRQRFEVVAVYLGPTIDDTVRGLDTLADEVIGPLHSLQEWQAALHGARLDALVWLDIGMDGTTQALAPLRFAPLQVAAWGHPVTTGLASIDAFLSSAAMEPDGAASHYSERLWALPALGIDYAMPAAARAFVRTPRNAGPFRFLCPQSVYKLGPVHDALFARILAAVPDALLTLIPHPVAEVRERLAARMRPVFAAHGVDFRQRVLLLPHLDEAQFLERIAQSDALLDSLDWSGGNTTLEALAFDTPVVTLPGAFMRGRHSAAMLSLLERSELIASDIDDYVAIAVRLATDSAFHRAMVEGIFAHKARLYDDERPTRALEQYLDEALDAPARDDA